MKKIVDIAANYIRKVKKVGDREKIELLREYEDARPHFDDQGIVDIFCYLVPDHLVAAFLDDVIVSLGLPVDTKTKSLEKMRYCDARKV